MGMPLKPAGCGCEPCFQVQGEVVNDSQTLQFAVVGLQHQGVAFQMDLEGHHGFHVELEDLQAGHHIAVAPRLQAGELFGVQQGPEDALLLQQEVEAALLRFGQADRF